MDANETNQTAKKYITQIRRSGNWRVIETALEGLYKTVTQRNECIYPDTAAEAMAIFLSGGKQEKAEEVFEKCYLTRVNEMNEQEVHSAISILEKNCLDNYAKRLFDVYLEAISGSEMTH